MSLPRQCHVLSLSWLRPTRPGIPRFDHGPKPVWPLTLWFDFDLRWTLTKGPSFAQRLANHVSSRCRLHRSFLGLQYSHYLAIATFLAHWCRPSFEFFWCCFFYVHVSIVFDPFGLFKVILESFFIASSRHFCVHFHDFLKGYSQTYPISRFHWASTLNLKVGVRDILTQCKAQVQSIYVYKSSFLLVLKDY